MRAPIAPILERLGIAAKLRGREWVATCPNPEHDDRSPSWRIRDEPDSPKHGAHHCFACGFGGSVLDLVLAVLDLPDAAAARKWVASGEDAEGKRAPAPPPAVQFSLVRRPTFRLPPGVEIAPHESWPASIRAYLYKRGIPSWQVARWGLGYAADGKLAGRVVFPYRDARGRVRGYTARTFAGDPKRYREADRRDGADPGAMFGEQHWPVRMFDRDRVYVTEGAINALAVERAFWSRKGPLGPATDNIAAIAGSGLRSAHAAKLATFAEVVVLTDPDDAGDKAAGIIEAAVGRHSTVRRVVFPVGKDAADLEEKDLGARLG